MRTPELAARERSAEVVGTIVTEPLTASEVDDDGAGDACVTFCPNYRHGRFGPTLGEPHIEIDLSWIVAAEAM